jgi:hypothetical protein
LRDIRLELHAGFLEEWELNRKGNRFKKGSITFSQVHLKSQASMLRIHGHPIDACPLEEIKSKTIYAL